MTLEIAVFTRFGALRGLRFRITRFAPTRPPESRRIRATLTRKGEPYGESQLMRLLLRLLLLLASIALYAQALKLPAAQGTLNLNDTQTLHFNPGCVSNPNCNPTDPSVEGWKLLYEGFFGFLFFGSGFKESALSECCWLANPLFFVALPFFLMKRLQTAAWLTACALVAALLIFLPNATLSQYSGNVIGNVESGYWYWLASLGVLFVASLALGYRSTLPKPPKQENPGS